MKKSCLLLLLCLSYANPLSAQIFIGGVSAGLSTSQVQGDNLAGYHKAGFTGGGLVSAKFIGHTLLSCEINFIQKGSYKAMHPEKNDYHLYRLTLNYVEVPLLLQLPYSEELWMETGLAYGTLLYQKEEDEYGTLPGQKKFHPHDFTVQAGLAVRVAKKISFNIRLGYSLLPVRAHASGATYYFNRGQYNNVLSFTIKYLFGKKYAEG